MSFNLNEASAGRPTVSYQKPGIFEGTRISKVSLEKTTKNMIDYISLGTLGVNGELGKSTAMYLSTDTKPGKKSSAWAVTARNLVNLIVATHNVTEEAAKALINVETKEQLVTKVSALLVGLPFRAKFKGVETARGTVIAELDGAESMKIAPADSRLKYDATRDIERYQGAPTEAVTSDTSSNDDLPF